jgi:precorrin-6A/cobalt-precorrin-6A reductase
VLHVQLLILGGTGEARALAAAMHGRPGVTVTSSLAGRVSSPALPVGEVRIGGFGGVAGLVEHLRTASVDVLVDATHPFAATISRHAVAAAREASCPLLVLRRPGWTESDGDVWTRVPDIGAAAAVVEARTGGCVFLTTGRRDLAAFAADDRHHYLVRTVEPPDTDAPPHMTLLLDRGPYTVDGEAALMAEHDVRVLVTKDSGGAMTAAKLVAARERGIPVVVVDRPALPSGVTVVETVDAAISRLAQRTGSAGE